LPILIDGIKCIPISSIVISLTFNSTELLVDADQSSLTFTYQSKDGKIYIIIRHSSSGVLTVGQTLSVSFTITGNNSAYFNVIPSITLTLVDPVTYQTIPTATALTNPVLLTNKATFNLQCSKASTIFWGLGIYPSILNSQALDFEARIISEGQGLKSNFT
jgi:hypothetical protein